MVSLKLKSGTAVEVKDGSVDVIGGVAILHEKFMEGNQTKMRIVLAYALQPAEIVRHVGEGAYIVEF